MPKFFKPKMIKVQHLEDIPKPENGKYWKYNVNTEYGRKMALREEEFQKTKI